MLQQLVLSTCLPTVTMTNASNQAAIAKCFLLPGHLRVRLMREGVWRHTIETSKHQTVTALSNIGLCDSREDNQRKSTFGP